jgi:hypothetical protein
MECHGLDRCLFSTAVTICDFRGSRDKSTSENSFILQSTLHMPDSGLSARRGCQYNYTAGWTSVEGSSPGVRQKFFRKPHHRGSFPSHANKNLRTATFLGCVTITRGLDLLHLYIQLVTTSDTALSLIYILYSSPLHICYGSQSSLVVSWQRISTQ